MKRCYGVLKFNRSILEKDFEIVEKILCWLRFIPLDTETSFIEDVIFMKGYSYHFDELLEGAKIPEYQIIIKQFKTDISSYEFILQRKN